MNEPKETIVLMAGLLASQLGLKDDRVFLYNQKWKIPTDEALFLEVAQISFKPFASALAYAPAAEGAPVGAALLELQTVNVQEVYQVTLFSRNASARLAQLGVVFALNGTVAQQLQEKHGFQIAALPLSFVDVSETEGSARLNKYAYTFNVLRGYSRERVAEYFSEFGFPPDPLLLNP